MYIGEYTCIYICFLGTVPGPILFGAILDNTCILWQENCDGSTGSCWIYDNVLFGRYIAILCICICIFSLLFLVIAVCVYKPPVTEKLIEKETISDDKENMEVHDNIAMDPVEQPKKDTIISPD